MKKYIKPTIKIHKIAGESILAASVCGTSVYDDYAPQGATGLAKRRDIFSSDDEDPSSINWDDEE